MSANTFDTLFQDAISAAQARKSKAATERDKTSSAAQAQDPEMVKLAQVRERAEDAIRLSVILENLGSMGIENLSFEKLSGEGIPLQHETGDKPLSSYPKKAVVPDSKKAVGDTYIEPAGDASPAPTQSIAHDNSAANPPPKEGQKSGASGGGSKDLSTPPPPATVKGKTSEVLSTLKRLRGGKYLSADAEARQKVSAALVRMGINSPEAALNVFVKSASANRMSLETYCYRHLEINHRDKSRLLWNFAKTSGNVDAEVSEAKRVVEGIVKGTGTLPDAASIAEAAGVNEIAANIALYETAELIAATGGEVAGAGMPGGEGPPVPEEAGMVPGGPPMPAGPPAGAAAGAPMPPMPPMPAPPMDPAMMGPPPGARGGMVAQASVGTSKLSGASLADAIRLVAMSKLSGDVQPSDKELPYLSGSDRATLDSMISSTEAIASTSKAETEKVTREDGVQTQLASQTSDPTHKGLLSTAEPVSGTKEGNLTPSSAQAEQTGEGEPAPQVVDGSPEPISKASASDDAIKARIEALMGKAPAAKTSSPTHPSDNPATPGTGAALNSAAQTHPAAVRWASEFLKEKSRLPSTDDLVEQFGIDAGLAKQVLAAVTE